MITKKEPLKLVSSKKMTMYKSDMYMRIGDRYKLSESLIIGEELKYLIISGQDAASLYNRYMTVFLNYRKFFLASHKFGFAKLASITVSDTFFRQDFTFNNIIYKRYIKNIESSLSMNIKVKDAVYVNAVKVREKKIKNSKKLYILKTLDNYSVGKISYIKSIISGLKINNMLHYTYASGKINTIYEPFKYINLPQKMSFVKEIFFQKNPLYSVQKPVNGEVEKAKVYGHNIDSNVILNKGEMYGYKSLSALYSLSEKKIENKSAEKNVSVTDRLMLYSVINNIYEKEAVYNTVNSNFMSNVRENKLLYMEQQRNFNAITENYAENIHKGKVLVSTRENTVIQEAIFNGNIYNVKNHELFSLYRRSVTGKSDISMKINIYNYMLERLKKKYKMTSKEHKEVIKDTDRSERILKAENISGHWESMHKYLPVNVSTHIKNIRKHLLVNILRNIEGIREYPSVNINILRHSEGIREYEYSPVNILRHTESISKYSSFNILSHTESISKYPSFNILSHTKSISKYLPSNILSHAESISEYSSFNILKHTEHPESISEYLPFNILSNIKSMSEYPSFNILSHTESISEYSSVNISKSGESISEYPPINISKGGESIRKYPSVNISKHGENIWKYSADNILMHVKGMHKYSTENMSWYEKNTQKYLIEKILRYAEKKQKHMTGRMLKYIENVQGYLSENISGYVQALPVFYSCSGEKNILNSQKNVSGESTLKETALNKERERFVYKEQTGYWKINKVQNVWNMEEAQSINRVQDIKGIHTLINAKNIGNVKDIENIQHFEDIQNKNIVQGAVETHELKYLHSQNSAESIKKTIQSIVERGQAVKTTQAIKTTQATEGTQATDDTQATDGIQTQNIAQTIESMQTTDVIYAQDSIKSIQGNVINRRENLEDILREQEKIKEINKMIDARMQSQVKSISKQVYESIEQKLRGEKRRRGF